MNFLWSWTFFKINFYWSILALQCHVSFYCTAKWIHHIYPYISSHLDFLPNQVIRVHLVEFLVLYSMFSWVIYFKHSINSIHASIPIFHSLPPPHSPWYPNIWSLCLCLYFCFANKIIYTIFPYSIYIYIYICTYKYTYIYIYINILYFSLSDFTLYVTVRSFHISIYNPILFLLMAA